MLRTWLDRIFGRNYDLRERVFRMLILVGFVLGSMGIVECVLLMDMHIILIPIFLMFCVLGISMIATFKYRRTTFAATFLGILVNFMVFPSMFFLSGGLVGGATIWFVLGIFYVFLMFSGRRLCVFLILTVMVDIATYLVGYYYPEEITAMASTGTSYMDSLFSMLAVGLAGGAILKFQMRLFDLERQVVIRQKEELEEISSSRNHFFASMSHEIRTPINTIIGLNEMVLRESSQREIQEYSRDIQNASTMLMNLVNDILDLFQMEMQKMEIVPMPYETRTLFQDLVDMVRVPIQERHLDFQVDIDEQLPSVLCGDSKRMKQVVLNLLNNAAKYTREGSVTLSAVKQFDDDGNFFLKISVRDTGVGIRKEDMEYLYDAFKRIDSKVNRHVEGSGLGLTITRQFLDLMEGQITVDSIYTKGSVFTITIPQEIVNEEPMGKIDFFARERMEKLIDQCSFEAPEARVLVVDDNEMNAHVEGSLLMRTKVQIDIAHSGKECLELTRKKYYHVILMDYMMPGMDGASTLQEIRKQENGLCRNSAVILLSANSTSESEKLCEEYSFDGYLEKPVHGVTLEQEVLKYLPEEIIEYRSGDDTEQEGSPVLHAANRKRRKVYVTTDCISDLPRKYRKELDIGVIYMYIRTQKGRFADTREMQADDLGWYLDAGQDVYADSVSVEEYEEFFAEALTQADDVIHISMAGVAGNSYHVAMEAARGFDHVHIIDAGHISCGEGLLAMYAAKLAKDQCPLEEIFEKTENARKRIRSRFILPSAKTFYEHGYTGRGMAGFMEICGLHPVLEINRKCLGIKGFRMGGLRHARKMFVRSMFWRRKKVNPAAVFITHAGISRKEQEMMKRAVLRYIPDAHIIIQKACVSTSCSAGLGTVGIAYFLAE